MKVDPDLLCKVTKKFKNCMDDKEDNFPGMSSCVASMLLMAVRVFVFFRRP